MKKFEEIQNHKYLVLKDFSKFNNNEFGGDGYIYFPESKPIYVRFCNCFDWEHVSVSKNKKCLSWEEMCQVKDIFWNKNECAIQYHPPEEDYINNNPYVLHIWKPIKETIPMPPKEFV